MDKRPYSAIEDIGPFEQSAIMCLHMCILISPLCLPCLNECHDAGITEISITCLFLLTIYQYFNALTATVRIMTTKQLLNVYSFQNK